MSWWEAVLLGVIQGATEFLPISSSGHLVIGQSLMDLRLPGVRFEVALHLATLISVIWVYRDRISTLVRGALVERRPSDLRYVALLAIATIPAGFVGVVFGDRVERLFESPSVTGVALLVTGALLFSTRGALRRDRSLEIGVVAAILIGIAQAGALVPGISRSGTTVTVALWLGIAPIEAAAFSFLMSIPAIAGAALLQIPDLMETGGGLTGLTTFLGALVAALVGVIAIRALVSMLENRSFPAFAWYCWAAGLLFLVWIGLGAG